MLLRTQDIDVKMMLVSSEKMRHVFRSAGVAQSVEQLIRNQQVTGSSPVTSSINSGGKPLFSMSGDLFLIAFSDVNLMPLVVYF